jgi:hypothetical protein
MHWQMNTTKAMRLLPLSKEITAPSLARCFVTDFTSHNGLFTLRPFGARKQPERYVQVFLKFFTGNILTNDFSLITLEKNLGGMYVWSKIYTYSQ